MGLLGANVGKLLGVMVASIQRGKKLSYFIFTVKIIPETKNRCTIKTIKDTKINLMILVRLSLLFVGIFFVRWICWTDKSDVVGGHSWTT